MEADHLKAWFDLKPISELQKSLKTPSAQFATKRLLSNMKRVSGAFSNIILAVGWSARIQQGVDDAFAMGNYNEQQILDCVHERDSKDPRRKIYDHNTGWIWGFMDKHGAPVLKKNMASAREMMLIGAWTALEFCIGDLWKESLPHSQTMRTGGGSELRIINKFQARRDQPSLT